MIAQELREARRQLPGEVVPSDDIVDTLMDPLRARVRPRIDLHINFEFDSASMTRNGRAQVDQLGQAMRRIAGRRAPTAGMAAGRAYGCAGGALVQRGPVGPPRQGGAGVSG